MLHVAGSYLLHPLLVLLVFYIAFNSEIKIKHYARTCDLNLAAPHEIISRPRNPAARAFYCRHNSCRECECCCLFAFRKYV